MSGVNTFVEIAVIGSGPGGALTAALLAEAGKEVVILEKGAHLPLTSCEPFTIAEMTQKYSHGGITVAMGRPAVSYIEGGSVGGGSEVNSGLYHRTPSDIIDEWVKKFEIKNLTYEKLIPIFKKNEIDLTISYVPSGQLPKASLKLHEGAQKLGWNSIEVPRWFRYESDGCGVKQSMTETFIPRAIKAGAEVISYTKINKVSPKPGGWLLTGWKTVGLDFTPFELLANKIFVCTGATATPALLRRSGLSSLAGKNLHMHPSIKIVAKFPEKVNHVGMGVPVHQVKEFSPRYSMGCSISSPPYLSLAMMDVKGGQEIVDSHWSNMAIYYAMTTGGRGFVNPLPLFKDPLVRYKFTSSEVVDILDALVDLARCLFAAGATEIYPAVQNSRQIRSVDEMIAFRNELEADQLNLMTIHLFSSCPMGENRQNTVVNSFGALHDHDGIYINDCSIIPTALGVNPQGTVMALARRNVEHFLGEE
ncbi:putative GMC-type oxidoreductase y4nJ [Limnohabitans sp. MORI2]|uniref:GMC family oxidoreductase n=1 Tax=Limnohabitans sp. MORI2 TaxID=1751150 RepID=UPI00237732F9|nr:GMC family oxidoreductase N-terminal domain-containing protein [Limnohabitans sp. MORI2]BDU57285.1 putative GMC-type oxidoreductase y4nJ [Limnohabitans sp. MORI2]